MNIYLYLCAMIFFVTKIIDRGIYYIWEIEIEKRKGVQLPRVSPTVVSLLIISHSNLKPLETHLDFHTFLPGIF